MFNKHFSFHKKQRGFTLVEVLVAVAITAIIGSAIATTVTQLFSVSIADKNRMEAVKQVENALHYINRDVQMASANDITPNNGTLVRLTNGLHLQWTDYDLSSSINNIVDYTIINYDSDTQIGDLQRRHQIIGVSDITTIVAHMTNLNLKIDEPGWLSEYSFDGSVVTIELTATVEGYRSATESRTLQVKPRIK